MLTLLSAIADYLETGEYKKKLSADTIKTYRIDLRQFSEFTAQQWVDTETLNQYIKYLNQSFAPRSVKRKPASVRAIYHEMEISQTHLTNCTFASILLYNFRELYPIKSCMIFYRTLMMLIRRAAEKCYGIS